jgi:hypothetical protein
MAAPAITVNVTKAVNATGGEKAVRPTMDGLAPPFKN